MSAFVNLEEYISDSQDRIGVIASSPSSLSSNYSTAEIHNGSPPPYGPPLVPLVRGSEQHPGFLDEAAEFFQHLNYFDDIEYRLVWSSQTPLIPRPEETYQSWWVHRKDFHKSTEREGNLGKCTYMTAIDIDILRFVHLEAIGRRHVGRSYWVWGGRGGDEGGGELNLNRRWLFEFFHISNWMGPNRRVEKVKVFHPQVLLYIGSKYTGISFNTLFEELTQPPPLTVKD
ncbi:hypothetical protein F5879DRAFT_1026318 [Lentinula edodes]|nr:hypothetical protein F5879DRAFT_1026318 [Lentinula edodes]